MMSCLEKDQKLVTVVIPFYSKESGLLTRAVESVLAQTYQGFNIVVVDDCSVISAAEELKDYDDPRIKIIKNKRNMNGAYSRNRGIHEAETIYVALLDADDIYLPGHLMGCIQQIKNNDFIYSNIVRYLDGQPEPCEVSNVSGYSKDKICNILLDSPPQTNSFFFKRSCFPSVKFDESLARHQDYQFFIDFCLSGFSVEKVDLYTACYIPTRTVNDINYSSVVDYWLKNKSLVDQKKLNKFMVGVSASILRKKEVDYEDLERIGEKLVDDVVFRIILTTKSRLISKYLVNVYYHLILDFNSLGYKLKNRVSKALSVIRR